MPPSTAPKVRILLVEDDPNETFLVRQMIEQDAKARFVVAHALSSLAPAIEVMQSGDCDLVLLDLTLPDSHGIETFTRAHSAAPDLPIIVLSGLADEVSGSTIATAVDAASPLQPGDRRTAARRRLDGLTEICRAYLASPQAPRGGAGGGHPHVIVTVDSDTLHRPDAPGSPGATLSWLGRITGATARRVACDAEVTTVDIGPDGEVRDTRSESRFFSPAQRRADRPRWRPLRRPLLPPARRLVRRSSSPPVGGGRADHGDQRRLALRGAPRPPP